MYAYHVGPYLHCISECVSNVQCTSHIWWGDDNGEGRLV